MLLYGNRDYQRDTENSITDASSAPIASADGTNARVCYLGIGVPSC
jgi:hypothetical protein